jgi:hypothetical protein
MSRRWKVLAAVAMVSCFSSGWFLQQLAAGGEIYQQARLFESVLAHVRDYHVDSIGEPELPGRGKRAISGDRADARGGAATTSRQGSGDC